MVRINKVETLSSWVIIVSMCVAILGCLGAPQLVYAYESLLCDQPITIKLEKDSSKYFSLNIWSDVRRLKIILGVESGDLDLYTRYGETPDQFNFDCGLVKGPMQNETCLHMFPQYGTWQILINAHTAGFGFVWARCQSASDVADEFVSLFINNCLARVPLEEELQKYGSQIIQDSISGSQLARQIFNYNEFIGRQLGNSEFVDLLFLTLWNSEPDETRLLLINKLETGMSRDNLISEFISSEKFSAMCADYGVRPY